MTEVTPEKPKRKKPNNAVGIKGRSGRKSQAVEIAKIKKWMGEDIEQKALLGLAQKIGYVKLKEIIDIIEREGVISNIQVKEFVMPILLKGITDKKEIKVKDFNSLLDEVEGEE